MSFNKFISDSSSTGFRLCGFDLRWMHGKAHRLKSVLLEAGASVMPCSIRSSGAILILVCFLLAAIPARATTYYVAAAGSDSNNGTSAGTPWQTISKVNGSAFSSGDSVLFNRGDAWYGTSLTVPSSGSSGSPITFGAYGSGANPILKGSTLLVTTGYTLAPNTNTTIFSLSDSGTSSTDSATRNWRQQVSHLDITAGASTITITVKASATAALNITGAGIGPAATAPNASSITRITWGGGNNGTTVSAGTSATSDQISYSLSNSVDQIVTIYTTARNVEYYTNNNETLWSNFSAPDQSQSATVSSYSSGGNSVIGNISSIQVTQFTYRNTLGSAPVAAWENGALLKSKASASAVESSAGSWYYDGTYLYLHASDGSNVSSNGKAYTYVTSSSPSFTSWDNGKTWLIFDSLDQAETYNTSSATLGGLYLTGSNSIVRNLSAHDTYRHPLTIYSGAANNTITNVTAYNSYGTSPLAIFGSGTTGNTVQQSTFYNDTSLSSAYVATGVWGVIVAHGASTNNTLDSCLIYSTAPSAGGYGLLIGDSGTTLTASHNLIYGTFSYGVNGGSGGGAGLAAGGTLTFFGNLLDISQANNVGMLFTGSTGNIVYNNTIYGPGNTNAAISQVSTSTGALVKNNIFWTGAYAAVDATSQTSTAYDYNDYFSASGTPFSWGGTAYNFANWKTNSSQDAHSLNSDPKLANGGSRNFTLLVGSPAIDAGTNLGSTYQLALSPSSSWPSGVYLVNQNTVGSGWEIGAFVFPPNRSTLLLMGCCD
jgi:parallel beta helix pectate lyase-like protein